MLPHELPKVTLTQHGIVNNSKVLDKIPAKLQTLEHISTATGMSFLMGCQKPLSLQYTDA